MLTVREARARAARIVEKSKRAWAAAIVADTPDAPDAAGLDSVLVDLPLHPPTERAALADQSGAIEWVQQWRRVAASDAVRVTWGVRRWPSIGAQEVPERLALAGADTIAEFAGASVQRDWATLTGRVALMRQRLVSGRPDDVRTAVAAVVRTHATTLAGYDDAEMHELLDVVEWLLANPSSGRRVRELPIRGIHTKWLERHRKVTEDLYRAVTGREGLGLAESQSLIRVRFVNPGIRPSGLTDLAMPLAQLAALDIAPTTVFVFENLETVLAMPDLPGAVVVHGGGYAVGRLSSVPWIREARIVYWGDLDSDGFRILHDLRVGCPDVTSVLMDPATVERYRDLAVPDPRSAPGAFDLLTDDEQAARLLLRDLGGLRIEQERIPWHDALRTLRARST